MTDEITTGNTHQITETRTGQIRVDDEGTFHAFNEAGDLVASAPTRAELETAVREAKPKAVNLEKPIACIVERYAYHDYNDGPFKDKFDRVHVVGITPGNLVRIRKGGKVKAIGKHDQSPMAIDPATDKRRVELARVLWDTRKELRKLMEGLDPVKGKDLREKVGVDGALR